MEPDSPSSNIGPDGCKGWESVGEQSEEKPNPGDIIWIKLSGGSWWPAVVVDENTVSEINNRNVKSNDDVPVRLYGSYKYMCVDYIKFSSELQMLKSRNADYLDVLKESMKQHLSSWMSDASEEEQSGSRAVDGRVATPRGKKTKRSQNGDKATNGEASCKNGAKKKLKLDSPNVTKSHKDLTPRRLKVMQSLGLTAPFGSPFSRDGHN